MAMTSATPAWWTDTITIVRAPQVADRYGDTSQDWDNATERDSAGWWVSPVSGGPEQVGNLADREALTRRRVASGPIDADVQAADRVRAAGVLYDVEGEPLPQRSPTGALDHLYVQLVRVEG